MSFVFPALLGAVVLAGIPILLHLILRQKPKTLPFPAFRFLVQRHQTNQRKLQLRHWLLLALRILLIAGLIFAIARPRLLQRNLGLSSETPVAAVFVIDVSASMDARSSDNRTRLDDAKKRALELLDELPLGSRVAVLSSSDTRGDWATTVLQARQRIQNFKIQPATAPLPRSIIAACRMLNDIATKREDEPGTRLARLLCVFSDTTRGAWNAAQTPQTLEAIDQVPVPRDVLIDAAPDINAVLTQLKENESTLKDILTELRDTLPRLAPAEFPLQGRPLQLLQQTRTATRDLLKSFGLSDDKQKDDPKDKLASRLRTLLNRLTGFQTMWFDVGLDPPRDLAILDLDWPITPAGLPKESIRPGETILLRPVLQALGQDFQATLTAGAIKDTREIKMGSRLSVPIEIDTEAQKLGAGFHSFEFAVNVRDILAINNQRFATVVVRAPRKALVISPTAKADSDFARALAIHDVQVDLRTLENAEAGIPAGYDAVILLAVPAPTDKLWQAVERFAKAGGGVAIVPGGDEMKPAAYQTPAAQAVLPGVYQQPIRLARPGEKNGGTRWDWQAKGIFRHPFLQPFERWILDDKIDFIKFPPRVLAFWDTTPAAANMVLMRYQDPARSPALLERSLGAGKVLQFTTPLDLRDPAWNTYLETIHSFYVVATGLMVRHLTGELEPVRVNFQLGREEASLPIRLFAGRGALTMRGPESGPIAIDEKLPRVAFPLATAPGNYQILDATKATVAAFSMNLPPEEIDLTPWPAIEIENLFGGGVRIASDRQANVRQLLQGRISEPVELFPILMVALLVLLAFENLLANRFYRRDEGTARDNP